MFHAEVDHAKTSDKIFVLAPSAFDFASAHTDILETILMSYEGGSGVSGSLLSLMWAGALERTSCGRAQLLELI